MRLFMASIFLFLTTCNQFASGNLELKFSILDDLKELNVSCPHNTCSEGREMDSLSSFACQCGSVCAQLGTCCIDSIYSTVPPPKIKPRCRSLELTRSYFMVDRCPTGSAWESLCNGEWYDDDDVMKIVPVTSLFSFITYKNYFCFRCHEVNDESFFWNVRLRSFFYEFDQTIDGSKLISLKYDGIYRTWMAAFGNESAPIQVRLEIEVPEEIKPLPVSCQSGVISLCSNLWSDEDASSKCEMYMGLVNIARDDYVFKYRNVHCALCNYEDLSEIFCKEPADILYAKAPFSSTLLLNINDKVDEVKNCKDDFLWDPFAQICREPSCTSPGSVIRNEKCVVP